MDNGKVKKEILDNILKKVSSWATFYDFIDECMVDATQHADPMNTLSALYTMHAFISAMKELPEESDIIVLVTKMVDILVESGLDRMNETILSIVAPMLMAEEQTTMH